MEKINKDKSQKKNFISWETLRWIALAIFIYWVLFGDNGIFGNNKVYEYSDCAEECVSDMEFCISTSGIYDKSPKGYIKEDDYEDCFYELDMCISDCMP